MPEVQDRQTKAIALQSLFDSERSKLAAFVKGIELKTWEQFALIALDNPNIVKCRPISIINALRTNARLSLPLDGVHAALVPFGDECTHVTGYPGYTALYVRHAGATHADVEVAFEGEEFEVRKGTDPKIIHSTDETIDHTDPEKIVATYCIVHLKGGGAKPWVCWRDELDAIRKIALAKAKGRKSPYDGGLTLIEMWRKAPLIRVRKGLNMTEGVQALLAEVEREEMGTVVDVEGGPAEASNLDEVLAQRKERKTKKAAAPVESEAREASEDSQGSASSASGEIQDIRGIPVSVTWDEVKDETFGGGNKLLGPLTPAKLVELLDKDKDVTEAAKAVLKKGQEIAAEGKNPSKPYQALALAFKQAENAAGF